MSRLIDGLCTADSLRPSCKQARDTVSQQGQALVLWPVADRAGDTLGKPVVFQERAVVVQTGG